MIPKRVHTHYPNHNISNINNKSNNTSGNNLKTSVCDWDSPSSYTGTVKRRPNSKCQDTLNYKTSSSSSSSSSTTSPTSSSSSSSNSHHSTKIQKFNNKFHQQKTTNASRKIDSICDHKNISIISEEIGISRNFSQINVIADKIQKQNNSIAKRQSDNQIIKNKSTKLRQPSAKVSAIDCQKNNCLRTKFEMKSTSNSLGKIKKNEQKCIIVDSSGSSVENKTTSKKNVQTNQANFQNQNYQSNGEFIELFNDFPECYDTTEIISNFNNMTTTTQNDIQPSINYQNPPTPPPISQMPSLQNRLNYDDKQRKGYNHKSSTKGVQTPSESYNSNSGGSSVDQKDDSKKVLNEYPAGKQKSPYKGCVTEIKNCISRGFLSLSSSSSSTATTSIKLTSSDDNIINKSSSQNTSNHHENQIHSNDYILYDPSSFNNSSKHKISPDDILTKPEFTSSLLKNIPVRPRKGGIPHLDNYCLFDPNVDFINEKECKKNISKTTLNRMTPTDDDHHKIFDKSKKYHTSSDKNDFIGMNNCCSSTTDFDEELIEEIIYSDNQSEEEISSNCCNHNYFTIDPDDFENEENNPVYYHDNFEQTHSLEAYKTRITDVQEKTDDSGININCQANSFNLTLKSISLENVDRDNKNFKLDLSKLVDNNLIAGNSPAQKVKPLTTNFIKPFNTNSLRSRHFDLRRQNSDLINYYNRTIPIIDTNYLLFNRNPAVNVPNKLVKYKLWKPLRPLSTHSDADSGFLSPNSPDELKLNPDFLILEQCDSIQGYIEIYTDWANYYLERAKSKKKVTDLSADCRDGLLLADIIEAVTSFKVPDMVKKPKNQQQMFDNVNSCLILLRNHSVGGLETITTNDICSGRLKAVLALFFALSKYKQQSKQQKTGTGTLSKAETTQSKLSQQLQQQQQIVNNHQQQQLTTNVTVHHNGNAADTMMTNRQIPVPFSKINGGTAIPLPATVLVQRRCPPDKVRPLPPTPNHVQSIPGLGKTGPTCDVNGITKLGSPPNSNYQLSNQQSPQKGNNNSLRQPQCKIPLSPYTIHNSDQPVNGILPLSSATQQPHPQHLPLTNVPIPNNQHTKHSMLDKLKLFNKDKSSSNTSTKSSSQVSKRTSSSSGFSSARSERSDSSLSLNDGHISQIRPPSQIINTNTATRPKDQSGNKCSSSSSSKQTKLFASSNSGVSKSSAKDGLAAGLIVKKDNKKEKSPSRTKDDIDPKLPQKTQKTLVNSRAAASLSSLEQQKAKSSSKLSLSSSKSGSKTSLVMAPTNKSATLVNSASSQTTINGTGIPKPMAAIKGTSKIVCIEKPTQQQQQHQQEQPDDIKKLDKNNVISNNHEIISDVNSNNSNRDQQKTHHIVNPMTVVVVDTNGCSQTISNTNNSSIIGNSNIINGPLIMNKLLQQNIQNISMSDSLHSTSTHSGLYSNSSESSVIYRPGSESGASSAESHYVNNTSSRNQQQPPIPNPIPNRKFDFRDPMMIQNGGRISKYDHSNNSGHQDMIHQNGHTINEHKYNTVPTKSIGTIYEEEKSSVTIMPMRPLLRGYNSHVTLPTRGNHGGNHHQNYVADFCESDNGQGYCSDGDALRHIRPGTASSRFIDIDNGYLSEGSIGIGGGSTGAGGGIHHHGKHFLSVMRARTQLPTTIEERIRGSRGSLNSIGTAAITTTSPSIDTSIPKIEMNGSGCSDRSSSRCSSRNGGNINDNNSLLDNGRNNIINGHNQHQNETNSVQKEKSNHNRRNISSSSTKSSSSSSGRTKGVPQSFGYVKRSNGSSTGQITSIDQQMQLRMLGQQQQQQMQQQQQQQQQHLQQQGRTALISAVPRSAKVKVSGGTQTCQNEMQAKIPPNSQHRSFSLTGPGATQLSQSIRERLSTGSHSLPKPGTDMHIFQHRITSRGKIIDGSLSDTQTYAEVKPEYSTYAMWLKHSSTTASRLSEGDSLENLQIGSPGMQRHGHGHKIIHRGGETTFVQSPRLNRSNSIRSTKSEKLYPSMLSRGPDVEIEPYYCLPVGTIQHGNTTNNGTGGTVVAIPWSQPTSPTPPHGRGFGGLLSPTHGIVSTNMTSCHRLTYPKKNDEVHGSAASLLSGGSSLYGSVEERQANEVRRLKRELTDARDQVMSLSSQLSTNAHVVAAFEQSLSNMTTRLQQLTATAERKDGELTDMRQTIELLRKQSIQAGLTTAHMHSMGVQQSNVTPSTDNKNTTGTRQDTRQQHINQLNNKANGGSNITSATAIGEGLNGGGSIQQGNLTSMQRQHSSESMYSLNSISSGCSAQDKKKKKGWLRSSFTKAFSRNAKITKTNRSNVASSNSSNLDQTAQNSVGCGNPGLNDIVKNSSLPPPSPTKNSPQKCVTIVDNAKPIDSIDIEGNPVVADLKKQLREKDLVLTDIRLEALSSASQLESLRDTVMKMRAEMLSLKQNNERLQKLVTSRSLAGSEISLGNAISPNGSIGDSRRYSLADGNNRPPMELPASLEEEEVEDENIPPAPAPEPPPPPLSPTTHYDLTPPPPAIEVPSPSHLSVTNTATEDIHLDPTDGKKLSISVYLGQPESFAKYLEEIYEYDNFYANAAAAAADNKLLTEEENTGTSDEKTTKEFEDRKFINPTLNEFVISYTYISGKTTWQNLDYIVRKTFKDYVSRIDPGTNLGLNTDSITSYHLGEAKRGPEMGFPELLPCGYIIGNVKNLYICLQGVGSLAFDSLIPRSIVHRYISLLTEHRRLILCGPSGTGKSYLARKLAEFLVARSGRGNPSEAIATFNVDHKSSKELRQYLGHIAEQASMANGASELPSVIILDNLHHASALGDVFSCLLSAGPAAKLPCIIGTMSQATCNTTNLQLHHNFRWVLTANHMEPVKGFLGRFLRRRVFTLELQTQNHQPELTAVLAWLSTVWQHINRFLENHSSSDVTIGPRLFLSCPLDLKDSQVWFTDVWNYHLAPYLVEAVREGVQLYGRRGGPWNDPSTFIRDTYPWPYGPDSVPPLRQINAEDVGLEDGDAGNSDTQDPLLNMLMRLQEAANYSGNQEQESDCASLDSNITADSSAGAE